MRLRLCSARGLLCLVLPLLQWRRSFPHSNSTLQGFLWGPWLSDIYYPQLKLMNSLQDLELQSTASRSYKGKAWPCPWFAGLNHLLKSVCAEEGEAECAFEKMLPVVWATQDEKCGKCYQDTLASEHPLGLRRLVCIKPTRHHVLAMTTHLSERLLLGVKVMKGLRCCALYLQRDLPPSEFQLSTE